MTQAPLRTVLVVDDEPLVRSALKRILEPAGCAVLTAADGAEALKVLGKSSVHVLITDQNMPGLSGIELLKEVRIRHPLVLRMMLTADADPETPIRSINEGEVYRFIRKPWDNAALLTTVNLAFEVILLEEENRQLLSIVRRQRAELRQLHPKDAEAELVLAEADLLER
jgi:DNA-binding NtrC family response regulator